MTNEKKCKAGGLQVHITPTKKFKTNTFVMQIRHPLVRENVTERALLGHVLKSATAKLPSRKQVRLFLDDLYGASFGVDVTKKGEQHILSFRLEVANEQFLMNGEPLLQKSLAFLRDILEHPLLKNNSFDPEIVEDEKRIHKQRMESIFDDKIRYSNVRLIEEMCKDEPYGLHPFGEMERLKKLDANSLYHTYQQLIQDDDIHLYVVGDVGVESVREQVQGLFNLPARKPRTTSSSPYIQPERIKEVTERQDVQQGKLHLGYRTPITFKDDEYPVLQVLNGLFGGFPHSKLFTNVREKESLAYYATSRLESHKGIIFVMAGIHPKQYDKALSIIRKQVRALKDGDFSEEDVEQTKQMTKNQLLETADIPRGLVEISYNGIIGKRRRPLEEWIEAIDEVTKEDVINCAETLALDSIYFLREKGK